MKRVPVLLITLCCAFLSLSKDLPETEIIIVGTVHKATEAFSADTLFYILERLQLDAILREHPIPWSADSFLEEVTKHESEHFVLKKDWECIGAK